MKNYLIEAFDEVGGYFQTCLRASSEQDAEDNFRKMFREYCLDVVEVTYIGE